jgi:AraC-like DNA-binding protein
VLHVVASETGPTLPTVTGFAAKRAVEALRDRGIPTAPLFERARLSEADLVHPKRRVPAVAQARFLEYAAEAAGDRAFGLRLAEHVNPREAGLVFYVASAGATFGDALTLFARYCRIVNESARLTIERHSKDATARIDFVGVPRRLSRQGAEFAVAAFIRGLREVVGRKISPIAVGFAHPRDSERREFERFFGCPVDFDAPFDFLKWPSEMLALPLVTADRHLLETLKPFCDEAARARNTEQGSLRAAVEEEVQRRLPEGKAQAQAVATALGVSLRTLSRRLAEEGTNYAEAVDQLRRSLALEYLKDPGLTLSQVAWLLGYEGSTSLNHAFKRWTGRAPSAARSDGTSPTNKGLVGQI